MKKLLFITFVSLFAMAINVSAKAKAVTEIKLETTSEVVSNNTFKGIVFDKLTNESLAGAVITANGQKVYTDLDGNFTLPSNGMQKCKIKVSLISYADQTIDVDTKSSNKIQIKLQQR